MRYQDITFTIDIDEFTQEQYDKLITGLGELINPCGVADCNRCGVGDINTMTYSDQMMKNLGVTS